jgi:hypothetical protein
MGDGKDLPVEATASRYPRHLAPAWLLRLILVIAGLAAWFYTQHLIGLRALPANPPIGDALLDWLGPWNAYFAGHPPAADALLIASSAVIDALGLFLLLRSVFGPSLRPFIGLLILFGLRQLCQATTALPQPPGIIWRPPGFPSLLVTYGVANDFFFSGHTALAVLGAVELFRLRRGLWPVAIFVAVFEATVVLTLRAHWTMDVFAGAMAALWAASAAAWLAPPLDRLIGSPANRG